MTKLTFRYYPYKLTPEEEALDKKIFRFSLFIPLLFILIIWMIKLSEIMLETKFTHWGVFPRHINGLPGIIGTPLVHADFRHLIGNSTSFLILSSTLFYFYRKVALRIFIINYILSGLFLWFAGRESWHIGASGIIYGLAAFLFFSGVFRRDTRLLTISLIVALLYGSFIWGLLPLQTSVSWEGHLTGAVSGIILSAIYYQYGPPKLNYEWDDVSDEKEEFTEDHYCPDKINENTDDDSSNKN